MLAGIKDILIISTPEDISKYEGLVGDGSSIGLKLFYKVQPAKGLSSGIYFRRTFIGDDDICRILEIMYSLVMDFKRLQNSIEM